MQRYITVRVVDSGGKPVQYAKVVLYIYQAIGSGQFSKETNSDGIAEFETDSDQFAEASVSVNSHEYVKRGRIEGQYKITLKS